MAVIQNRGIRATEGAGEVNGKELQEHLDGITNNCNGIADWHLKRIEEEIKRLQEVEKAFHSLRKARKG